MCFFLSLAVIEELKATGKFERMDLRVDEAEHSMEMHLPYIAKVFEGYFFTYGMIVLLLSDNVIIWLTNMVLLMQTSS